MSKQEEAGLLLRGAASGFILCFGVVLLIFVWTGFGLTGPNGGFWWTDAVKSGVGEYDSVTGKFQWKSPPPGESVNEGYPTPIDNPLR